MENLTTTLDFVNKSVMLVDNSTELRGNITRLPPIRLGNSVRLFMTIFVWSMFAVGVVGNGILIASLRRKKQKGSTDTYILGLAACDILSLLTIPVGGILAESLGSDWLCRLYFYIRTLGFLLSTMLVFSIGVDRYFKVFRPHSTARLNKVAKPVVLSAYVTSVVSCVIFIFASHQNDRGHCKLNPTFQTLSYLALGVGNLMAICFSLALSIIYGRIAVFLRRRERSAIANRGRREIPATVYATTNLQGQLPTNQGSIPSSPSPTTLSPQLPTNQEAMPSPQLPTNQSTSQDTRSRQQSTTVTRTTLIMMLVTLIYFLSTVLPAIVAGVLILVDVSSEAVFKFTFFALDLPFIACVANPILFAITSSEFRERTAQMIQSCCRRRS